LQKVQSIQNAVARLVTGARRCDHITPRCCVSDRQQKRQANVFRNILLRQSLRIISSGRLFTDPRSGPGAALGNRPKPKVVVLVLEFTMHQRLRCPAVNSVPSRILRHFKVAPYIGATYGTRASFVAAVRSFNSARVTTDDDAMKGLHVCSLRPVISHCRRYTKTYDAVRISAAVVALILTSSYVFVYRLHWFIARRRIYMTP